MGYRDFFAVGVDWTGRVSLFLCLSLSLFRIHGGLSNKDGWCELDFIANCYEERDQRGTVPVNLVPPCPPPPSRLSLIHRRRTRLSVVCYWHHFFTNDIVLDLERNTDIYLYPIRCALLVTRRGSLVATSSSQIPRFNERLRVAADEKSNRCRRPLTRTSQVRNKGLTASVRLSQTRRSALLTRN